MPLASRPASVVDLSDRGMRQIIEALNIFLKYDDPAWPFHCEHDVLTVHIADPMAVSDADVQRLKELGFERGNPDAAGGESCFYSFQYGSC